MDGDLAYDDSAISAEMAGRVIKASLGAVHLEGRFPGGSEHVHEGWL